MAQQKSVYRNPKPGQPLLSTISTGCKTPILKVKFCNLINPFRYANSPTIPRYSITCIIEPKKNKEFLNSIQAIERDEKVETIIKNDTMKQDGQHVTSGNLLIKFQAKDKIPVYMAGKYPEEDSPLLELEDELEKNESVVIVYDILRYTKKNTAQVEHGLSFKPTKIYYYPDEA